MLQNTYKSAKNLNILASVFRSSSSEKNRALDDLDVEFYRIWYPDLTSFSDTKAMEHWKKFGSNEGRHPNFSALLESLGYRLSDIPADFNSEVYFFANEFVNASVFANRYKAAIHYLSSKKASALIYKVDFGFYRTAYSDLRNVVVDQQSANKHWLDVGRLEGRYPCISPWLVDRGFKHDLVPNGFSLDEYRYIKGLNSKADVLEVLNSHLKQDDLVSSPVSKSAYLNSDFYFKLGLYHEKAKELEKASNCYLSSVAFLPRASAFENLGNISFRDNLFRKACMYYNRAIDCDSNSKWSYLNWLKSAENTYSSEDFLKWAILQWEKISRLKDAEDLLLEVVQKYWLVKEEEFGCLAEQQRREELVKVVEEAAGLVYELWERCTLQGSDEPAKVTLNTERVLIVGDFFIPQCVRYRIDQKVEQLRVAGYQVATVDWINAEESRKAVQFCDQIIFYRVPAVPQVIRLIAEARALGKRVIYEIDDLLFDPEYPPPLETYGGYVNGETYRGLTRGMALFRAAARLCDEGIASTRPLAEKLGKLVRSGTCHIHRNGLDGKNVIKEKANSAAEEGALNIFYGSGTQAHNTDFIELALPALERVLSEYPKTKLTIVGYLNLPDSFVERYQGQLQRVPMLKKIESYWRYLEMADINIAVLHSDGINDCKSELKWFEAACFGIPSILSWTQNYADVIRDGQDGLLVKTPEDWYGALKLLIENREVRERMGSAAKEHVVVQYGTKQLAKNIAEIFV